MSVDDDAVAGQASAIMPMFEAVDARGPAVNMVVPTDGATDQPHTAHTTDVVPLILVTPTPYGLALADGRLADVAPTLLALLGLPQPEAMEGRALVDLNLSSAPAGDRGPARGRRVSA